METNENNRELADKKWNAHQEHNVDDLNEGFSGNNIPDGYDPSHEPIADRFKDETETDASGNKIETKRERHPDGHSAENARHDSGNTDNSRIENQQSLEHRDLNYDPSEDRYPPSFSDNDENRGNLRLDDE
jgi:hypothetical protein